MTSVEIDNGLSLFGMPFDEPECSNVFTGLSTRASGTVMLNGDGSGNAELTLIMDINVRVTDACLMAVGDTAVDATVCSVLENEFNTPEFPGSSCELGSGACDCMLTSQEMTTTTGGAWSVSGSVLTTGEDTSDFCVDGDTLRLRDELRGATMRTTLTRS